jgi:23S rRNA (pseudouridine1915-N3)-methyltransferase
VRLGVLAIGRRMPGWVEQACEDYLRRFDRSVAVTLRALAEAPRAGAREAAHARRVETDRLLAALAPADQAVLLDRGGESMDCETFAARLAGVAARGPVAFLIGGADGIEARAGARACWRWSLGPLTLPHALARVVVIEQIYRAYTIWRDLPYHRGH